MYILTTTAKRKGAKRHIVSKHEDIKYLEKLAGNINNRYTVDIYDGKWALVEKIK